MYLRTIALLIPGFLVVACSQQKSTNEPAKPQPNIIYILADDLGYGDLSVNNEESAIHTPHMDRLAREGMSFSDGHSASAVCTPTRYGILTGQYCWRSSLKDGVLWGYSPPLIQPTQTTIASFLLDHGYRTGVVGKWHLGLGWHPEDQNKPIQQYDWNLPYDSVSGSNVDYSQPVTGGPNDLGFEYSYIFPSSLDMTPYLYLENGKATDQPTAFTAGKNQDKDGRGVFWRAGEVTPGFDFDHVLHHLVSKGVDFIKKEDQRPFFLYLPLTAPHTPWLPTDEVNGTTQAGKYGDFVKLVDNQIGLILQALDQLKLTDNTLVVLSSDNGAHWTDTDKELYTHRSNYIFRGMKADIYEGGHRVPFIFRWPGMVPSEVVSDQLLSTTDFMATMAGVIGEKLPAGAAPDSYDLSPVILGKPVEGLVRDQMIQHSLDGLFAIRSGKWKYTPVLGSGGFTQPKSITPEPREPTGALYDLETDIGETNNLISKHPSVARDLHAKLEEITGQQF
jgi:arylsulfatase A-like enzyme